MIDRVQIKLFRCLKEVDVPLKPLTVLVGPNDSGKSTFLQALRFFAGHFRAGRADYWRLQEDGPTVSVDSASLRELRDFRGKYTGSHEVCAPIERAKTRLFLLPSSGVQMTSPGHPDSGGPPELQENGTGVATLLDYLVRNDRERFDKIESELRRLIPGTERIHIGAPSGTEHRVDLSIDGGLKMPGEALSVGVRLVLFFVALAYHPSPPKLILLEEPENGVHPRRLKEVIGLLREITEGKHGAHASQVILTTHSPYLLDQIDPTTDQVLVFSRNDDGSRTAEPADESRLKNFLDEFMLGEVWYNEGEEGLVAKKTGQPS